MVGVTFNGIFIFIISLCVKVIFSQEIRLSDNHPDTYLSIEELIHKYGYPLESHEVTTEDGYLLNIFRIPHGKGGSGVNKKPVLMVHGLLGESENFICLAMYNGSLAFLLADNGYDVWLANTRGTDHGKKHLTLSTRDKEFWNFSWHEIGKYDVPATIDYVLEKTKKPKLYYVGYSQGGTVFLVLTTVRPEYQKKILMASLLAPAGYMHYMTPGFVGFFAKSHKLIMGMADQFNLYEVPTEKNSIPKIFQSICINSTTIMSNFCVTLLKGLNGIISEQSGLEMLPLAFRFIPTVSIKQIVHYLQVLDSGKFRYFDHGSPQKNTEMYSSPEPPYYQLETISVPVAFYFGAHDAQVEARDVRDMCNDVQNCVELYQIKIPSWSHYDYIYSNCTLKEVNLPVLRVMQKYNEI
ncbi:hypothetical protein HHI36_020352 [Cryptolaemus montrouzieri]|uniref:Lipase n=1 Tax=Cryptolaemus montrouzieri TaxID=559131 RepID=A0ABD2NAE8_9CUCU